MNDEFEYVTVDEMIQKAMVRSGTKTPIEALRIVLLYIEDKQIAHAIVDLKTNQTLEEMIKETLVRYEND